MLKAYSLTYQNFVKVMSIGIATYVRVCAFLVHHSEIWVMHFLYKELKANEKACKFTACIGNVNDN